MVLPKGMRNTQRRGRWGGSVWGFGEPRLGFSGQGGQYEKMIKASERLERFGKPFVYVPFPSKSSEMGPPCRVAPANIGSHETPHISVWHI